MKVAKTEIETPSYDRKAQEAKIQQTDEIILLLTHTKVAG